MAILKDLELKHIIYQKVWSKITTSSSMQKKVYDQPIDSDIKRYEEIRKITTWQGKNYTTEYLLDYDYVKGHYGLTEVG